MVADLISKELEVLQAVARKQKDYLTDAILTLEDSDDLGARLEGGQEVVEEAKKSFLGFW